MRRLNVDGQQCGRHLFQCGNVFDLIGLIHLCEFVGQLAGVQAAVFVRHLLDGCILNVLSNPTAQKFVQCTGFACTALAARRRCLQVVVGRMFGLALGNLAFECVNEGGALLTR